MSDMLDELFKKYKKSPITMSLILICIVIYIISFILYGEEMNASEAISLGAYNPMYVYFGHQYWRLLTSNFIHFGILHIVVNCYSLYGIGGFIESVLKVKKYIIVLFVSALFTTGVPYILFLMNGFESYSVSAGISGVIFGLIGSLGALAIRYRNIFLDIFRQLAPNVIFMLLISFLVPSISLSGHLCGLIGGFIGTNLVLLIKKKDHSKHFIN